MRNISRYSFGATVVAMVLVAGLAGCGAKADSSEESTTDAGALVEESSSEESGETASGTPSTTTQSDAASFTDYTELGVTVSDTDLFCVMVAGRGGYYDDVGYLISVENKGDVEFFANARSPYTLGTTEIEPNFSMVVGAHETGTGVLWFAADEVGDDQSVIFGTVEICDKDGNVLGTCALTL